MILLKNRLFDENLNGNLVDASLDYKADGLSGSAKNVQKARSFYALLKKNIQRVRPLKDFCGIKNVVQMHDTMEKWQWLADCEKQAVYFLYPKGQNTCVGCMTLKRNDRFVELGGWLTEDATGKGYMQEAMTMAEDSLSQKNEREFIRRFYINNPDKEAVEKSLLEAGYTPREEGIGSPKENKVFKTYHLTKEQILARQKNKEQHS